LAYFRLSASASMARRIGSGSVGQVSMMRAKIKARTARAPGEA
jgi:hypothetical protein